MDRLPIKLAQGDLIEWTESDADYKASAGWTLKYRLSGPDQIDIVSTASGDDHAFSISSAVSDLYSPGSYQTKRYVTKGTSTITLEHGTCEILKDLSKTSAGTTEEGRSHARIVLDALKANIEGTATLRQKSQQVNGKAMEYIPLADLIAAYHHYDFLVKQEEQAAEIQSGIPGKKILTRFDPIS